MFVIKRRLTSVFLKEAGRNRSRQDRKRAGAAERCNLKATGKSQRAFGANRFDFLS